MMQLLVKRSLDPVHCLWIATELLPKRPRGFVLAADVLRLMTVDSGSQSHLSHGVAPTFAWQPLALTPRLVLQPRLTMRHPKCQVSFGFPESLALAHHVPMLDIHAPMLCWTEPWKLLSQISQ